MTGPEHYAEAERLLREAADLPRAIVEVTQRSLSQEEAARLQSQVQDVMSGPVVVAGPNVSLDITPMLRAAQVHATLALAAAQGA